MRTAITLEEFTKNAQELRRKSENAEKKFLDYLVWGESQDFWRGGWTSYLGLLKHLSLVEPARYDAHKKMNKRHPDLAAKVSVDGLVEAAKFEAPAAQREVLEQAAKWEETNETPISKQSAEMIGRDLRSRAAALVTRNKSYATVVAELETAKREVARLTMENKNLRAEIATLKRQHKVAMKSSKTGRQSRVARA